MARNTSGLKRGGSPGRPKGSLNRKTLAFEEFWAGKLESEEYRQNLWRRIAGGRASHMETFLATKIFGAPKQNLDLTGEVTLRWKARGE